MLCGSFFSARFKREFIVCAACCMLYSRFQPIWWAVYEKTKKKLLTKCDARSSLQDFVPVFRCLSSCYHSFLSFLIRVHVFDLMCCFFLFLFSTSDFFFFFVFCRFRLINQFVHFMLDKFAKLMVVVDDDVTRKPLSFRFSVHNTRYGIVKLEFEWMIFLCCVSVWLLFVPIDFNILYAISFMCFWFAQNWWFDLTPFRSRANMYIKLKMWFFSPWTTIAIWYFHKHPLALFC